jgi:hypothetical protein
MVSSPSAAVGRTASMVLETIDPSASGRSDPDDRDDRDDRS